MERTIGVTHARESFKKIVDGVQYQGDKYIVERHGLPAIAIVPLDVYEEWKRSREAFFATLASFQENSGDNDPDEIMALVLEAQEAVRSGAE